MRKVLMLLEKQFPEDERVEKEALTLIRAGYEVHMASFRAETAATYEQYKGIHIHRKAIGPLLKKTSVGALKFPFYFNFWRTFLNALYEKHSFDIIHVHDLPLARVGFEMKEKFDSKYVLDLHEHWPSLLQLSPHTHTFLGKLLSSNRQWEAYEAKSIKRADHVIVVIEEAAERLGKLGLSPEKITVVSNTMPIEDHAKEIENLPRDPDAIILGYAGGIQYLRGLQYVVEAMPLLVQKNKNIKLWIVGDGRHLKVLQDRCKGQLEEHVRFFGHLSYQKMMARINQFDIGLIPHLKTPLTDTTIPNKLFQYMYLKKPVLTSNCAPLERIVKVTDSGLVYQYDSPEDLAEKALRIIADQEQATKFGINGKKAVLEEYNWKRESDNLIQLYCRLYLV